MATEMGESPVRALVHTQGNVVPEFVPALVQKHPRQTCLL